MFYKCFVYVLSILKLKKIWFLVVEERYINMCDFWMVVGVYLLIYDKDK